MISPAEIKTQALKWWKPFLQSYLKNEIFFPKQIDRIGKIKSSVVTEKITELQMQLEELYKHSKEKLGYGYTIVKQDVNFRRTGSHSLPQYISFETADDFVGFIGKKKEWAAFLTNSSFILQEMPQLNDWLYSNPVAAIENDKKWENILKVCNYFIKNPEPQLYLRQLPVNLHTKFIEENETIIKSLLDFLIPEHIKDVSEKSISKRFHLKYDEPTVRIRILDELLKINNHSDVRIPLGDFNCLNFACNSVLLTENKMNFLALPALPSTIAIWSGGGFMISHLKNAIWLNTKSLFYWGDLDAHGFLILHQMRSYFSHTKSVMMDRETFDLFKKEGVVSGKEMKTEKLSTLTESELAMFSFLKENNYRLEQEKIRQEYVDGVLMEILMS